MDYDQLLRRVREHTGLSDSSLVESVVRAVTEALGALIDHAHRDSIAARFPDELAPLLRRRAPEPDPSGATFLRLVHKSERLPIGFAAEHGTAVLEAIGSELHPEERRQLASLLPVEMRDWLEPRVFRSPPPSSQPTQPHPAHPEGGHHLADARPGSEHPVSEAAPSRAQSESIAANPDPHAGERLASAHGLTQEREREDLAEGQPGSERSLAESGG